MSDLEPLLADPVSTTADPELTRRLRDRYTEIAQLAGGLAHEIRNPLSTMRLNLDLLAEDFQAPESPRDQRILKKIERVRKESHRLESLLEDFLRFARARELHVESIDLNAVVDDLRDFCEPQAASQGIVLRTHDGGEPLVVRLDVDMFKQALFNLIRNAQHAMPDGGELILTARRSGSSAVLDVVDTGCGIPADLRDRIFEPFFSTRPAGTGLGLPTVRKIVEAHGGSLGLESEMGKGSKFTIRLPMA